MDEMIFLPCRIHQDGVSGTVIIDDHGYQHLNLPCEVDHKAEAIAWFRSRWAKRLLTDGDPVIITSRIFEEEEGKNE